jgi:hypothetical protein
METYELRTAKEDQAFGASETAAVNAPEDRDPFSPLCPLPPGPWRSLGQHLDYTDWPARERFMELDRAIEASRILAANEWRSLHRNAA